MKKYLPLLLILLLFSCVTKEPDQKDPSEFKVWSINSMKSDKRDFFPELYKDGKIILNINQNITTVKYLVSDELKNNLEAEWKKRYKGLELDEIIIMQTVSYTVKDDTVKIKKIKTNYLLRGKNIKNISKKIEEIIYTDRAGESFGLLPLIYHLFVPDLIRQIPLPQFKNGESFTINKTDTNITVSNKKWVIDISYDGLYNWVGF